MVIARTWRHLPPPAPQTLKPVSAEQLFVRPHGRPPRWFISHSYADKPSLRALIEALPPWVEPVIFPPVEVSPDEFVTDELAAAISPCDGLVYVADAGPWVNFERRYALRRKMRVGGFHPGSAFQLDTEAPHNILAPLWNTEHEPDHALVQRALAWLQAERAVHPVHDVAEALKRGGTPVVFLSNASAVEPWPRGWRERLAQIDPDVTAAGRRCLFAWLEEPRRDAIELALHRLPQGGHAGAFQRFVLHGRADERLHIASDGRLNSNRLDDLLVQLEFRADVQKPVAPDKAVRTPEEDDALQKRAALRRGVKPWEIDPLS